MDRIYFGMPENREEAWLTLPVVQDYVAQVKFQINRGQRPTSDYEVWVHWSDEGMRWARPLLWEAKFLEQAKLVRGEWDYAYEFDMKKAYELSSVTEKSAVEILGVLAGAAPPRETPVLVGVPELEGIGSGKRGVVAVMPGSIQEAVIELVQLHWPEADLRVVEEEQWDVDRPGFDLKAMIDSVREASLVIAERSWRTSLIGGMDKFLLEFHPADVHKGWFSKWKTGKYQMVVAEQFSKAVLWVGLEETWNRWTSSILPG